MSFTVTLTDAAAQYGISDLSAGLGAGLESTIGTQVSSTASWGSGQLATGQSGTVTFAYSKGFSIKVTFTADSATAVTLTDASLFGAGNVKLASYVGSLSVSAATFASQLSDATALAGNDTIIGNAAANILEGYSGGDQINGGAGVDTVIERGLASAYTVIGGGPFTVIGPDGTDTLTNVERIRFDDSALAFDAAGVAGQAYRLYQAALDRAPDAGGLGYYIGILDPGFWHLHDIAGNFLQSPEFAARYGNTTNLQFVQQLYLNILHRAGETDGVQFHLNELAAGLDRAQLLVNFSESPENQTALIGVMSQGMAYIPS